MSIAKEYFGLLGKSFITLGAVVLVIMSTAWILGFLGATWFWPVCALAVILLLVGVLFFRKSIHFV
jgi:membrane-bound ClpP family serine protease